MHEDIDDAVLDELYAAARTEFIALRNANAKRARTEGHRELASRIAALRKPSMAAWLLNRIAREHREQLDAAFDLGERMRAAHRHLDGAQLRTLSAERHRMLDALLADAAGIADAAGQHLSDPAAEQLRATIDAALRDPAIAERISIGRLDSAVLENDIWPDIEPTEYVTRPPPAPPPEPPAPDPAARARARQRAADAAEAEQLANHAVRAAHQAAAKTSARLAELRTELAEAKRADRQAQADLEAAEHAAELATAESSAAHQDLT